MLERLTPAARALVIDAQARARALRHDFLGDEHLLLAVAASESAAGDALRSSGLTPAALEPIVRRSGLPMGPAERAALASIGIDLDAVVARVEAVFGPGALGPQPRRRRTRRQAACGQADSGGHLRLTARAKECLALSLAEARGRSERAVDVPHVALALTALPGGPARAAMATLGVPPDRARAAVLDRYRRAG